ncbi:MAG: hypothetical protein HQ592_18490, partial [Planctomycetes bacterium]|nr:hypothetical protein [Planctomycetota bacterium]
MVRKLYEIAQEMISGDESRIAEFQKLLARLFAQWALDHRAVLENAGIESDAFLVAVKNKVLEKVRALKNGGARWHNATQLKNWLFTTARNAVNNLQLYAIAQELLSGNDSKLVEFEELIARLLGRWLLSPRSLGQWLPAPKDVLEYSGLEVDDFLTDMT